jgi:serine protease
VNNPAAGIYTIELRPNVYGASSFSGVTMEVNPTIPTISIGQSVANLSSSTGYVLYNVTVPSGTSTLMVRTSGGSGSMTITVYQGSGPASGFERCSGGAIGATTGLCTVNNPAVGIYTIELRPNVYGASSFSGVTMEVLK